MTTKFRFSDCHHYAKVLDKSSGGAKSMRKLLDGSHLEEIGEGWLSLGGDGSGMDIFNDDPVAKINAPKAKDRVDTAYLARLGNTDFVQWYGRKSDGYFWPFGRILRLTHAGKIFFEQSRKGSK
jgi:hypothetical protein